jgi:diguanylate cyclase (GGDEF)-like protein
VKHSIKNIFSNIKLLFIFSALFSVVAYLFFLQQNISYSKIENLEKQKEIIESLKNLKRDNIDLALIQFNGKSTQLLQEINKLRNLEKYNYLDKYIFNNSSNYFADLNRLETLTKVFNKLAHNYYTEEKSNDKANKIKLANSFYIINKHIDSIIFKIVNLNKIKFYFFEKVILAIVIISLFSLFWYAKRLNLIYNDLLFLYAVEENKKAYNIFSTEADAISLRMKKKTEITNDPTTTDPVTEINNYKGMLSSYASKKDMKESNFTSVSVLEIDNFSKSNRVYPQEYVQAILKKVAFTISLHEQPTDVIARTDYNQFTVILSRASKEQAFKDMEMIRQSISEIKFKLAGQNIIQITVTGAFVIKQNNKHLDDIIKQAKELLRNAKTKGKNNIYQTRDLIEEEY